MIPVQCIDVFVRTNQMREEVGMPPLPYDPSMHEVASARASSQAGHELDHIGAVGGENLCRVAKGPDEGARAMETWRASEPHYANIISPIYIGIAVGYYPEEGGEFDAYVTFSQCFTAPEGWTLA